MTPRFAAATYRSALSTKAGAAVQIPPMAPRLSTRDLAERVLAATAALRCGPRIGAGFFVAPDEVVTNLHVSGQGGDPIEVRLRGGQTGSAWVERSNERLDVALLRVSGLTTTPLPLPLGDATLLGPGSPVLAAGSPVGLDFTVTQAILSHAERTILGVVYLQFDGSVNPGNSGGPLVDDAGRAIGRMFRK
jgi:serine protease Do